MIGVLIYNENECIDKQNVVNVFSPFKKKNGYALSSFTSKTE
jgi:hypothetical protein